MRPGAGGPDGLGVRCPRHHGDAVAAGDQILRDGEQWVDVPERGERCNEDLCHGVYFAPATERSLMTSSMSEAISATPSRLA